MNELLYALLVGVVGEYVFNYLGYDMGAIGNVILVRYVIVYVYYLAVIVGDAPDVRGRELRGLLVGQVLADVGEARVVL